MDIDHLQRHWNKLGEQDPLWAILTRPDKKGGRWTIEEFFQQGVAEIDSVMEYLRNLGIKARPAKALDFGCGVGRLTQALAGYCDQVVGVDIAPSMIEQAIRFNSQGDRCRYLVNAGADLTLVGGERFDLIYTNMVLQHMPPAYSSRYIGEFVRILGPGGVAVFQIPAKPSGTLIAVLLRILPTSVVRVIRKMDMYGTPRDRVIRIVQEAGGEVLDIRDDTHAGPHWIGYRYCVRKPS
jgi:ubiquinone/menaquinone biosynthesis C-methylase UbiE